MATTAVGGIDNGGQRLPNVGAPMAAADAVPKGYADNLGPLLHTDYRDAALGTPQYTAGGVPVYGDEMVAWSTVVTGLVVRVVSPSTTPSLTLPNDTTTALGSVMQPTGASPSAKALRTSIDFQMPQTPSTAGAFVRHGLAASESLTADQPYRVTITRTGWTIDQTISGTTTVLSSGTFTTPLPQDGIVVQKSTAALSGTTLRVTFPAATDTPAVELSLASNPVARYSLFQVGRTTAASDGSATLVKTMADTSNNLLGAPSSGQVFGMIKVNARMAAPFTYPGSLSLYTGQGRWYNDTGRTLTLLWARASVGTAPTGASVIVDVKKNGTTVFTTTANRPTIAAGTNTSGKSARPDVLTLADGDYLTVDIAQIGSTVAGSDLAVQVMMQ